MVKEDGEFIGPEETICEIQEDKSFQGQSLLCSRMRRTGEPKVKDEMED